MKHLIETTDLSSLGNAKYDRLILDSTTNEIIYKGGGVINANGHSYVDLGLPSGLKWAKCNVGATSETDYGSYFQWGDIEDKSNSDCSWESYKYGDGSNFSKYNTGLKDIGGTIDNKATLDLEDDAARVHMGGDWRMPTRDEIQELIDNTTNKWITNYNSGVNGRKFTSKINGNSIFIPAAGVKEGSSVDVVGEYTTLWSSSLNTSYSNCAWYWAVGDNDYNMYCLEWRCLGFTVRGVL